jgi:hypothetical protein
MATNEFLPFAEGGNPNVESLEAWEADSARINGFTSGIAKSKPVNRILKQGAVVSTALGQLIVNNLNIDAKADSEEFLAALTKLFAKYCKTVNGSAPDESGNINIPLDFLPLSGGTVTGDVRVNGSVSATNFFGKATTAYTADSATTATTATKATTADSATTATTATSATKATQDGNGNTITSTYIKNITISGRYITVQWGNDTTTKLTTQDTTYTPTAATSSTYGCIKPSTSWTCLVNAQGSTTSYSYTATQNCFIIAYNTGGTNNSDPNIYVGGTRIYHQYSHHNDGHIAYPMIFLTKGQTVTYSQESCTFSCYVLYMG